MGNIGVWYKSVESNTEYSKLIEQKLEIFTVWIVKSQVILEITFTMQICNDPTNGCMYCMCIHMYPSCLNIINQFDGYRTAAVRKPCFVRTKRNLKNPAKRLKLLCLLPFFCWPRKTHTHKAMIISWKTTPIPFECRCICTVIPSFIGIFSLTFIALQHSYTV